MFVASTCVLLALLAVSFVTVKANSCTSCISGGGYWCTYSSTCIDPTTGRCGNSDCLRTSTSQCPEVDNCAYSDCASCAADPACFWCTADKICRPAMEPKKQGQYCGNWGCSSLDCQRISAAQCPGATNCNYTGCKDCAADPACFWCTADKICRPAMEPKEQGEYCHNWGCSSLDCQRLSADECPEVDNCGYTDCKNCAADPACFWCTADKNCRPAMEPKEQGEYCHNWGCSSLDCQRDSSSQCPAEDNCQYSSCSSCVADPACHWCASSSSSGTYCAPAMEPKESGEYCHNYGCSGTWHDTSC